MVPYEWLLMPFEHPDSNSICYNADQQMHEHKLQLPSNNKK
jgi:hypothetical protein